MDRDKKMLSWLHLSDLHRCPALDGGNAEITLSRLKEDLEGLLADGPAVDLIFFTGDVAFGQIPEQPIGEQLLDAWQWIEEIREICKLETERIFVVPGNHDVNRSAVKDSLQGWLRQKRQAYDSKRINQLFGPKDKEWPGFAARLADYREWIEEAYPHFLSASKPEHLVWAHVVELDGMKIGLGGFDSAWSCGENDEKGKLWLAADAQLGHILPTLESTDIRIALIHHPPSWLVEAEDPGNLRSRLQSEFDVLLHGHEHLVWVETPQKDHLKIAAGAVHDRSGHAEFGYNLARFEFDGSTPAKGEIWLRRWDRRTGRWTGDSIPDRTDNRGVWTVDPVPWRADPNESATGPDAGEPLRETHEDVGAVEASLEPAPPTAAEGRGVFGRSADLEKFRRSLEKHRLIWVHGLSGVGKSTLIQQSALEMEREVRRIYLQPDMGFEEIYSRFGRELGSPDPDPRPIGVAGKVHFKSLKKWGRGLTRKILVHVEGADIWLEAASADPRNTQFLEAILEYLPPTVRLAFEGTLDPRGSLPEQGKKLHLHGLDPSCLGAFFRKPLPEIKPDLGWTFDAEDLDSIAARVAGDRHQRGDLHPLALILLTQVADGLGLSPVEVLETHSDKFEREVTSELFELLIDNVLTAPEYRLLRLLALYREGIIVPGAHSDLLASRVDPAAFGSLVRRSVLDHRAGDFHLHSLLRRLAARRIEQESDEALGDHGAIAEAWLRDVRRGRQLDLADIAANNEAFHHLEAAGNYLALADLQANHLRKGVDSRLEALGKRLKTAGRHPELKTVLELWTHIDENEPKAFRFLGEVLVALEGPTSEAAVAAFRRAITLAPHIPHHWSGLGRCLLQRGEGGILVRELEELQPSRRHRLLEDRFVASIYASAVEQSRDRHEAQQMRLELIEAGTQDPVVYVEQAKALVEDGLPQEALDILDKARENRAEDDYSLSIRGRVLEQLGRGDEAQKMRLELIEAGTRDPVVYSEQAKALLKDGLPQKALDILDKARENGAEDGYSPSIRGQVLERLGRGDEAQKMRLELIEAGTRDPVVYAAQAKALLDDGFPQKALDILDKARENGAEDSYSLNIRGRVLEQLGRGDEAQKMRSELIEAGTLDSVVYVDQAKALVDDGLPQKALDILDKARENGVENKFTASLRAKVLSLLSIESS